LRAGSPAGGDLATWWTARADFGRLLTPKRRMDARARFDWPVNRAWTRLERVRADKGGFALTAAIHAYAPFATRLQFSLNGEEWRDATGPMELLLPSGEHRLSARVVTGSGWAGKAETLHLRLP
jgi:hypothetical protein